MLYINLLTEVEKITLEAMRDHHRLPITRKRAYSILLELTRLFYSKDR